MSMEDMFSLPHDQTQDMGGAATSARETRRSRRSLQHRPRMVNPDANLASGASPLRMVSGGVGTSDRSRSSFVSDAAHCSTVQMLA